MVRIIPFPTDEEISDKLFEPKDKYAILAVGKNMLRGYDSVPNLPRWSSFISGNLNLYDWELLLTGTLDFGERSPLNALSGIGGTYKDKAGVNHVVNPGDIVRSNLVDSICKYEEGKLPNGSYREVAKIWPGTTEVLPEFRKAVERFAELSDDKTLTTVIVFSHGEEKTIQMGSVRLSYDRFLKDLDKINGKKTVFVYACHSGSFLKKLRLHERRKDYAAIASCEASNLSTNWNDRALDDYLFRHFSKGARFSDLELQPINGAIHNQHPQMLRYFDARLV